MEADSKDSEDSKEGINIPSVVREMRDKQDGAPVEKKINTLSFLKMNNAQAERIQKDADESQITKTLNHLIFSMIPCRNKKLTEEEVQNINLGGGIVACVMVAAPNLPLNHPFLILGIRLVSLYIKVRMVCNKVTEEVHAMKSKLGGIKEGFETLHHK